MVQMTSAAFSARNRYFSRLSRAICSAMRRSVMSRKMPHRAVGLPNIVVLQPAVDPDQQFPAVIGDKALFEIVGGSAGFEQAENEFALAGAIRFSG